MSLQFLDKEKNKKQDLKKGKRENEVEKPEFIGILDLTTTLLVDKCLINHWKGR